MTTIAHRFAIRRSITFIASRQSSEALGGPSQGSLHQFHSSSARLRGNTAQRKGETVSRILRNEHIRAPRVRLVNPETNELIPGPILMRDLLESVDRKRYIIQQVALNSRPKGPKEAEAEAEAEAEGEEDDVEESGSGNEVEENGSGERRSSKDRYRMEDKEDEEDEPIVVHATLQDLPIVKLIDKKAKYERERAKKRERQEMSGTTVGSVLLAKGSAASAAKEVVFTWNATKHDVHHKLQPMRNHLIKRGPGASCVVTISSKKGQAFVKPEVQQALLAETERYLCDWDALQGKDVVPDGEAASEEASKGKAPSKLPYFARRRAEVEWNASRRAARLRIEVSRR